MKILVICAGDRSNYSVALNSLKYLCKNNDILTVCVLDKNKPIINFLKKKKLNMLQRILKIFLNR